MKCMFLFNKTELNGLRINSKRVDILFQVFMEEHIMLNGELTGRHLM